MNHLRPLFVSFFSGLLLLAVPATLSIANGSGQEGGLNKTPVLEGILVDEGLSGDVPIKLALKFVELLPQDGSLVLNEVGVKKLLQKVNSIYSQCNIEFDLEEYSTVHPDEFKLPKHPNSLGEMENFRKPFDDSRYFVIVKTGKWDHQKVGPANAWTAMPGDLPSGVVIESPVSTFAGIVAHELGHYLSLYHKENSQNLMNPLIYQDSTRLTPSQCGHMRSSALQARPAALRG